MISLNRYNKINPKWRTCYNCIHCRAVVPLENNRRCYKNNKIKENNDGNNGRIYLNYRKMRIFCRMGEWIRTASEGTFVYHGIYNSNLKKFKYAKECPFFETDE